MSQMAVSTDNAANKTQIKQNEKKPFSLTAFLKKGDVKENIELYSIMLPVLILIFIFCYIPMYGVIIAFQDYTPGMPFIAFDGSVKWVGLKHFVDFIQGKYFLRLTGNTILLSIYSLAFSFWIPIAFALLMNEIKFTKVKRVSQTISYMPYFISSVIVASMVLSFIRPDGIVNKIVELFGGTATDFSMTASAFPWIYTITNIWKTFGYSSILYMSTMASVDPELYEACKLDGGNRWSQMWHVTLPAIKPTIVITFVMAVGGILNSNTEMILLLYNTAVYETADVIGTYIYRDGLLNGHFSYSTAVGILLSVINFILLYIANKVSNKLTDFGLW